MVKKIDSGYFSVSIYWKYFYKVVIYISIYSRSICKRVFSVKAEQKTKNNFLSIIIITKSVDQAGLSFYKKAVSAHGRMIAVEDGEDKVSIYYFRIPVSKVEKNDFY
jgi:hypothetical protein